MTPDETPEAAARLEALFGPPEPGPDPTTPEGVIFAQPIPDFGAFAALLAAMAILDPARAAANDDAGRLERLIQTEINRRHRASWTGRQGWRINKALERANKAAA